VHRELRRSRSSMRRDWLTLTDESENEGAPLGTVVLRSTGQN
jgi:hypothetical protein